MYLTFYNLKKQPFHITPDPEFLFLSPSHKEALAAIIYGIEERKGFVAIIGAVGVGKTTILRSYLEKAEKNRLKVIYVFNSKLTFEGLLRTIFQEMGLQMETNDPMEMINRLYGVLIEEYRQGNTVVLIVDEAQNMPVDTLESLRMISNLETSKDKLIQIVLAGQPEFEDQLNLDRLRQFKQRLAIRSTILPLTKDESLEYIKFRLQRAGSDTASVFTAAALNAIIQKAAGIPRLLNVLCDNALISGFGYQQKPVSKKLASEIIRDFEGAARQRPVRRWLPAAAGLAVLLLLIGTTWLLPNKQELLGKLGIAAPREQLDPSRTIAEVRPVEKPGIKDEQVRPTKVKAEPASSVKRSEPAVVTKTVTRGDTLSQLVRDVYGLDGRDPKAGKLLDLVRLNNPQIKDADVILPGQKIAFPDTQNQVE
jgi:general secretion pathway protein A